MDLNAKCDAAAKLNAATEGLTQPRPIVVKCFDGSWYARLDNGDGSGQSATTAEEAVDSLLDYLVERADKEQDKLIRRLARINTAMNAALGRSE